MFVNMALCACHDIRVLTAGAYQMLGQLENRIDIIGAEDVQAGGASDRPGAEDVQAGGAEDVQAGAAEDGADDGARSGARSGPVDARNYRSWRAFAANAPGVFVRPEIRGEDGQLNLEICGYGCFAALMMALVWCH